MFKFDNYKIEIIKKKRKKPLVIATSRYTQIENIKVTLYFGRTLVAGYAAPNNVTNENKQEIEKNLSNFCKTFVNTDFPDLDSFLSDLNNYLKFYPSCINALDTAAHNLYSIMQGKKLEDFIVEHYELENQKIKNQTGYTIGIKSIQETISEIDEFKSKGFKIFKIKLSGTDDDIEKISLIGQNYNLENLTFYADANQSYNELSKLSRISKHLQANNFIFLEQPSNMYDLEKLIFFSRSLELPILADESFNMLSDYKRLIQANLPGYVIKLMKFGGIRNTISILKKLSSKRNTFITISCMSELYDSIYYSEIISEIFGIKIVDLDSYLMLEHP